MDDLSNKNFSNLPLKTKLVVLNEEKTAISPSDFVQMILKISREKRSKVMSKIKPSVRSKFLKSLSKDNLAKIVKKSNLIQKNQNILKTANAVKLPKNAFEKEINLIIKCLNEFKTNSNPNIVKLIRNEAFNFIEMLKNKDHFNIIDNYPIEYCVYKRSNLFHRKKQKTIQTDKSVKKMEKRNPKIEKIEKNIENFSLKNFDVYSKTLNSKIGHGNRLSQLNKISKKLNGDDYILFSKSRNLSLLGKKNLTIFKTLFGKAKNNLKFVCFLMWQHIYDIVETAILFSKTSQNKKIITNETIKKSTEYVNNELLVLKKKQFDQIMKKF